MIVDLAQSVMDVQLDVNVFSEYRIYTPASVENEITCYVTENGTPVSRTVRLYRRSDGVLAGESMSDGTTGECVFSGVSSAEYFLVVLDSIGTYNAIAYDRVTFGSNRNDATLDFSGSYTAPAYNNVNADFTDQINISAVNNMGPAETQVDFYSLSGSGRQINSDVIFENLVNIPQYSEKRTESTGYFDIMAAFLSAYKPLEVKPPEENYSVQRFWTELTDGVTTINAQLRAFTLRSYIDRKSYGEFDMIYNADAYDTFANMINNEIVIYNGFVDFTSGTTYKDVFIRQTIIDVDFDIMTGKIRIQGESTFSPSYKNVTLNYIVSRNIRQGGQQYRVIGSKNDITPGDMVVDKQLGTSYKVAATTYYVSENQDYLEVMENV